MANDELLLRALDVPVPSATDVGEAGELVVMTIKPAFAFAITLWFWDGGGNTGGTLGAADMASGDLLRVMTALSRGETPPPAPSHRLERTSITRRDCDAIHEALANAALYSLPEKPLTGTDGLVLAVDARRGRTGLHGFTAWAPGQPHTAVLRALCEPVLVRFRAHPWITSAVTKALDPSADELV